MRRSLILVAGLIEQCEMVRRYRRRKSAASQIIRDTTHMASRLGWKGCIFLGLVSFVVLFWLIPVWFEGRISPSSPIEPFISRKIHFFKYLGIASAIVCLFFAIRNYYATDRLDSTGKVGVGFFARLLARFID